LGEKVVDFVKKYSIDDLKTMSDNIELVDEGSKPTEDQICKCQQFRLIDLSVSERSADDWYCLLRKAHGNLELYSKVGLMIDNSEFLKDSLFCEWAYIVNLDDESLDVYHGFQKEPPTKGLFSGNTESRNDYYPVDMIKSYPISNISNISISDLEYE